VVKDRVRLAIKQIAVRTLQHHIRAAAYRHVAQSIAGNTLPQLRAKLAKSPLLDDGRPEAKTGKSTVYSSPQFSIGGECIIDDFLRSWVYAYWSIDPETKAAASCIMDELRRPEQLILIPLHFAAQQHHTHMHRKNPVNL
jgi:hypothetical protein